MLEEKNTSYTDRNASADTGEAVCASEKADGTAFAETESFSPPKSENHSGGSPSRKGGGRKKRIIAIICATVAVLATVATVLGILLRGEAGDESPAFFTVEFLGLERAVTVTGEAGSAYTPPDTEREGYEFEGWYSDADYTTRAELPDTIPAKNMRFYARYSQLFTVNFWEGETLLASYTGKAGSPIDPPETQKDGFECEGWFSDKDFTQPTDAPLAIPEGGGNFFVKYAELFTVIFLDGEKELFRFAGKRGTPIAFDAPQKDGYDFEGWTDGTKIVEPPETIEGNYIFYAQFAKLYTVVFWDEDTELYRLTAKAGTQVHIPQPEKDGYVFKGWKDAGGSAITPADIIGADANYYSVFAKLYSVNFLIDGESVRSFETEAGELVTAPAAPNKAGYTFVGWFEKDDETQTILSFPQKAEPRNVTYFAFYGENPRLTFHANPPFGTEASGDMAAFEGEYGKPNACPAVNSFAVEGYEFAGWAESADGRAVYSNGAEIVFSAHKELFAQWARAYKNADDPAVIFDTELADGYPVYAVDGKRISGEIETSPLGDREFRFGIDGAEMVGRLNADGSYQYRSSESGWYSFTDGKAYLGGYGEALFACGEKSERGSYHVEMENLLYYEGGQYTGTYLFDRDAREMRFVDNRTAYGNYYGEDMGALVLGAQVELGGTKGVYVVAGETVYFYFNGVKTEGKFLGTRVEYGGNTYERIDGELTFYGDAGELSFTPNGSVYESAAVWRENGEEIEGTVKCNGETFLFCGGGDDYKFEWNLELRLSTRSVYVTERKERIRYVNADEYEQYLSGERDAYGVLWRITDKGSDVIEGNAFITAEGAPFFVVFNPQDAAKEYNGELNGITYTYQCAFGDGFFRCKWYGIRESAYECGAFRYEVVEFAGGIGYEAYAGYEARERISVRLFENGEEISPEFLFLRGLTEVSLITEGAHAGRFELSFTRNEWGYLNGMTAVKYRNLSAGNALLAMDGEREISFLFYDGGWREADIFFREEHGYPLLISEDRIFLREGETLNECEYRLFDQIKTLIIGARVLYAEVETENGVRTAEERDGVWHVEEELYTLRIVFTGSGAEMKVKTERIDRLFCAAGERYRERTEIYYTMSSVGVLGRIVRIESGGREQEMIGAVNTERGLCIRVSDESGEGADWLFTAGEPEITFVARQEETLGGVAQFTIVYTDDWFTVLGQARFYLRGAFVSCDGAVEQKESEWIWRSTGTLLPDLEIILRVVRGNLEQRPFDVQADGLPKTIAEGGAEAFVYTSGGMLRLGSFSVNGVEYKDPTEPMKDVYFYAEAGYLVFLREERISAAEEFSATDGSFTVTYAKAGDSEIVPLGLSKNGIPLSGQFTAGNVFVWRGGEEYSVVFTEDGVRVFEGTPTLYALTFLNGAEEKTVYAPAGAFELPELPVKEGYRFLGWRIRGEELYTGIFTVSENVSFIAEWTPCKTVNVYLGPEDASNGKVYAVLEVKQNGGSDWVFVEEDLSALGLLPQKEGYTATWYVYYADETGEGSYDFPFEGEWYDDVLAIVLIWE